jgi:transposase
MPELFECEVIEEREVLQEAELSGQADSENDLGGSSETMYFIGLDVHKKSISYCVKDAAGRVYQEGKIGSSRRELDVWIRTMPQPRMIAMEATIFSGWIYDHLLPHAEKVKVAHPLMLRAIAAAKRKNDKIDAGKIADCLRCDFLPECHMASTEIRDRRRTLRYRSLVVKQMVQMKNRVSGLLMETGVSYNKQRLHKVGYFQELMTTNQDVHESIRPLLKLSREMISRSQKLDYALISSLERDPLLKERLRRLRTVPGVEPITAVTWALRSVTSHASHRTSRPSATADFAEMRRVRRTRCCACPSLSRGTSISSAC